MSRTIGDTCLGKLLLSPNNIQLDSDVGGYGSGRRGGRPTADASLRLDLAWMLREGLAIDGRNCSGTLRWSCRGRESGSIGYRAMMDGSHGKRLELEFSNSLHGERKEVRQIVRLTHTTPNFGGRRWWMLCPVSGQRVAKLYLPAGGDLFASRQVWRLGYQCQRDAARDKPFERLFRLQKKLGCPQGWQHPICKPKGMWARTWERHLAEYHRLNEECSFEIAAVMGRMTW